MGRSRWGLTLSPPWRSWDTDGEPRGSVCWPLEVLLQGEGQQARRPPRDNGSMAGAAEGVGASRVGGPMCVPHLKVTGLLLCVILVTLASQGSLLGMHSPGPTCRVRICASAERPARPGRPTLGPPCGGSWGPRWK